MVSLKKSVVLGLFALLLAAPLAVAKEKKRTETPTPSESFTPVTENNSVVGSSRMGLGLAFLGGLTETPTALSLTYELSSDSLFQGIFSVGGTAGGLSLNVGGLYKRNVMGGAVAGLHMGGGLAFGTYSSNAATEILGLGTTNASSSQFGLALTGFFGVHAAFPGTNGRIMISADAGPRFLFITAPSGGSSYSDFSIQALSSAGGLSIIYLL
jgi:hypothetical protein